MADMAETKTVTISGLAAESLGGGKQKKPRQTRKSKGGDLPSDSSPSSPSPSSTLPHVIHVSTSPPPNITKVGISGQPVPSSTSTIPASPHVTTTSPHTLPIQSESPATSQGGKIRVELKKKPQTKKVQLHPKKAEAPKTPLKKMQTKKNRKVLLGVSSLHKRMTRAKKVHTAIKAMSLEKLKALLLSKKLIKPTSKAPESVLRQIASDAGIVEQNAL
jgi:hypothetical protein